MTELPKPANFHDLRQRQFNWMDAKQSQQTLIRSGDLTEDEQKAAEQILTDLNITPIHKRKSDGTGTDEG